MTLRSNLSRAAVLVASGLLASCGARTGLRLPDVPTPRDSAVLDVVDALDAADVPPACVPGRFQLVARAADLLLVADRSTSMSRALSGGGGTSKWRLLRDALAATLPRFQDQVNVGALFYPEEGAESRSASCVVANVPTVDVEPAVGTAPRVIGIFDGTGPSGSTPTASALLRAYTYIVRHPDRSRARYLVLATDGAPDCNASLDPSTCVCVQGGGRGCRDAVGCLDDVRTVSTIAQIASNPVTSIPVYVIGIAGSSDATFSAALTAMAVAGGRPHRTARGEATYYDVQRPEDLTAAFSTIENAIARCTFVTPSRPTDPDAITISLGGVVIPRDPSRVNGWDWTDRAFGELTLFGAACPRDASPTTTLTATVACRDE